MSNNIYISKQGLCLGILKNCWINSRLTSRFKLYLNEPPKSIEIVTRSVFFLSVWSASFQQATSQAKCYPSAGAFASLNLLLSHSLTSHPHTFDPSHLCLYTIYNLTGPKGGALLTFILFATLWQGSARDTEGFRVIVLPSTRDSPI